MWGPRAIIDTAALQHNLAVVRRYAPHSKVMAVIKANAYGHGIVPCARALTNADAFGVARLAEGLALREHGLAQRIVLLEGVFTPDELTAAANHSLDIVVHSFEQLALLKTSSNLQQMQVWLKIDTGMNRLGFRVEDFAHAWQLLRECQLPHPPRVMTHLSSADERDSDVTRNQLERFDAVLSAHGLSGIEYSAANSAGLIAWPKARFDWVRPGLMLYGISPFSNGVAADFGLRPVMTLTTRLIAIRDVKAGEQVGYGGTWTMQQSGRVGIAAVGYGDGYPRQIGSGSPVLVNGIECSVTGRVSMDMIAIHLASAPQAQVGDEVTLWGEGLAVERMAHCAGTIPYELVCGISQRVDVEYR